MPLRSLRARSTVSFSRRRAIVRRWCPHAPGCVMSYWSGAQSAAPGDGTFMNPRGITPITVKLLSSRLTMRPTIAGSPLNRRRHNSSLSSTTAGPLRRSSDALRSRPIAGAIPSTRK